MSAESEMFDASLKKKKKKPEASSVEATADDAKSNSAAGGEAAVGEEIITGKKKKKGAKAVAFENEAPPPEPATDAVAADEEFDPTKLKKKSKKAKAALTEDAATASGQAGDVEPDFSYDELLTRVINIMREKNPEMGTGEKKKFTLRPPQVMKAGSKKTAFANFMEICKLLKRQPKHLLAFLLAELGASGSIDGSNQLIIKGKFQQRQIESVLRKYIKEYVTCHTCKSSETELQKDTRLFFLQCETCGSRCSVASIKTGFQAITTKRAVARNAIQVAQ